jgi:dGTPase
VSVGPDDSIRRATELREHRELSPLAAKADASRGRERPEAPCPLRTDYQRDRDRIIHQCKSFRRLAGKTQVFLPATGDHLRTRLTHTLEVCQIARTIGRGLALNEDLIEAITLGHDLGHTPFGHVGERALDAALREVAPSLGFTHYAQSLRVVDLLERDGRGVNLTFEVRDGIRHHSKGPGDTGNRLDGPMPVTLEGKVVRWSDRIAYVNHDLDDARRAGILFEDDVPPQVHEVLGSTHSERITTLVGSVIRESLGKPYLEMAPEVAEALDTLKDFLFRRVYLPDGASSYPGSRGEHIVRELFAHYTDHPEAAPFLRPHERELAVEERARRTADFIAGMTDRFACDTYVQLFVPSPRPDLFARMSADL